MPARRRKRRQKEKERANKRPLVPFLLIAIVLVVGGLFTTSSKYWDSKSKLTLLVHDPEGDVSLMTFDPVLEEISIIVIPSNTEVEVAQHFGTYQLGNVWKLGQSEGLGGRLLSKTITKNFKFPVYIWSEKQALGFASTNYIEVAKAVISSYSTNLSIGDRLKIATFSVSVPNSRRVELKLSETPYLIETRLVDGQEGFVIGKDIPVSILSIFANPVIAGGGQRVVITNNTGNSQIAERVGEVVEVLGVKVASVRKGDGNIKGCMVGGNDSESVEIISEVFDCTIKNLEQDENFDMEIVLGSEFEETY